MTPAPSSLLGMSRAEEMGNPMKSIHGAAHAREISRSFIAAP